MPQSSETRVAFAQAVLEGLGFAADHNKMIALLAWMAGENTLAAFNPLATTTSMPGSTDFNTNGGYPVQNYTDFKQGVKATIDTLQNGNYAGVLDALNGNSSNAPSVVTDAVAASPWGTKTFPISQVTADFQSYASIQLGTQGGGGGTGAGGTGAGGTGAGSAGGTGAGGGGFKSVNTLPGVKGKDYHFVTNGGRTYVVYGIDLGGVNKTIRMAWRVSPDDVKALGVSGATALSNDQFKTLQVFGSSTLITQNNSNVHPWNTFVQSLQDVYGHVSWLNDAGYMKVMMEKWFMGWDSSTLTAALQQTKWYKSQTDWQRSWATKATAERKTETTGMVSQMEQAMQTLYGDSNPWTTASGHSASDLTVWAKKIMSGKYGDPTTGFNVWLEERRNEAKKVSGSTAWMTAQTDMQAKNNFINGPEDLYGSLRDQASQWLGFSGKNNPNMSDGALQQWARDIFMGTRSQEDFNAALQNQASSLYPYLPSGTPWQQFADPYRARAEAVIGQPIDWSNPILQNLGGTDASGAPTGNAMSLDQFERNARHTDAFWNGSTAQNEGFNMIASLDSMFNGVTG